jgi:hypothetical protein
MSDNERINEARRYTDIGMQGAARDEYESLIADLQALLDQHREWTDSAQNAALRAQKERDDALSRLDSIRRFAEDLNPTDFRESAVWKMATGVVEKPGETFVEKALGGSNQLYRTLVEKRSTETCEHRTIIRRGDGARFCDDCHTELPRAVVVNRGSAND